jgi:alpha-1,3-rhamnosyl/mannosyltransferase
MRVLINLLVASGRKTGIGHYASQLARCLAAQMGVDELEIFPRWWLRRAWGLSTRLRSCLERKKRSAEPAAAGAAPAPSRGSKLLGHLRQLGQGLLSRHLQGFTARQHFDLYHEPNYIPLPADLPTVVTLHDLSVLLHPEWHPADRVAHYERYFLPALGRCDHILAVSEHSRQEIIRILSVPPGRVTRTYLGVRPGLRPLAAEETQAGLAHLGLPPRYLLFLGTIEPRKNILFLLRTYCALPDRLRSQWPLLLVGSWGWNTASVREYLHQEARHCGVIHLGYVAEESLNVIYNGAQALLYPSLYEGFGLPPVEMLACGGAVLASTAGALVETVGSCAHLLPADDADAWRKAIMKVVEDEDWWRGLRRDAVEVARPFTWQGCAAATLRAYRAVVRREAASVPGQRAA